MQEGLQEASSPEWKPLEELYRGFLVFPTGVFGGKQRRVTYVWTPETQLPKCRKLRR
jgi:hypothetical protein